MLFCSQVLHLDAIIFVWAVLAIYLLIDGHLFTKMWATVILGLTPLAIAFLGFALGGWFVAKNQEDRLRYAYNTTNKLDGASNASLAFDLITLLVMWALIPLLVYKALRAYIKRKTAAGRDGTGGVGPAAMDAKRAEVAGASTGAGMRTGGSRTQVDIVPTSNVGSPV